MKTCIKNLFLLPVLVAALGSVLVGQVSAPSEPAQAEQAPGEANDSHAGSSARNKWNWLAGTRWYVPGENLLAYLSDLTLTGVLPVADQTIWSLTEAGDGRFVGTSYTVLWAKSPDGTIL